MRTTTLGKISDIITGPFGSQLHMEDYVEVGIPVIMPQNIGDRVVDENGIARISEEDFQRLYRYSTKANDIVYARRGDVEKHAFISDDGKAMCGTGCLRVRVSDENVYPLFLSFYLNRPETRRWLTVHAVGSNMPNLNTGILSDVPLVLPDYKLQIDIADTLQRIDNKISCNNRINDNLQQMAKTIYDYWFTQFDFPDENGKPYRSSGGQMVWNEQLKREIPDDWTVASIVDNPISSVIKPGVEHFTYKEYLATAEVNRTAISNGTIIDYDSREIRANMQPSINSVWLAKMKNSVKHLFLNKEMQPLIDGVILSTGFCGIQCDEIAFEYISSFISSDYFEIVKDILAHGATQEAVNNDDMLSIRLLIPDDTTLSKYHEATNAIFSQVSKNICENRQLIQLRDWLLPMLMNGQATVAD